MHFNHDGSATLRLGLDLVHDPPTDAADLARRCADAGVVLERAPGARDVTAVRAFLATWSAVADLVDEHERAAALNLLLAEHTAPPVLTDHDGDGWHLHHRVAGLRPHEQLAAVITSGTALHLTTRGMSRFGRCAEDGCERLFADVSRNGRQRFCSVACGNRAAARRHRARAAGTALGTGRPSGAAERS